MNTPTRHVATDEERFPLLTDDGRRMLRRLWQHPHAPRYTYRCGDRLNAAALTSLKRYGTDLESKRHGWKPGEVPDWVDEFVAACRRDVPFYRDRLPEQAAFEDLPTLARDDIRQEPWSFVPDSADISELIVYPTSGTSGNLLNIITHPVAPSRYLPLMQAALRPYGVEFCRGDRVAIAQVAMQVSTYTFASVSSFLEGAGFVKINLHPADWHDPQDRVRFLDDLNPGVFTGDPYAFEELSRLPLQIRPKALISSATTLFEGQRRKLQSHFRCPVIDMYSLNESGPVSFDAGDGHEILPHDLFVEILDPSGRRAPPGTRGEITLTGGVNPFLPLVRYRTGDHAALDHTRPIPRLTQFDGRHPVLFVGADGRIVSSIDVTVSLFDVPLPLFSLQQDESGVLMFRTRCDEPNVRRVEAILKPLFGADTPLRIEQMSEDEMLSGKPIQYRSACAPARQTGS